MLSFFVVLLIWIDHHELFRMVNRVDRVSLFANESLLLMVTFIPFPTAMLARYFGTPAANTAVAFYCGTFLVSSLCHNLLFESVARNRRLLRHDISDLAVSRLRRTYHLGLAVHSLSVLVAIFSLVGGSDDFWRAVAAVGHAALRLRPRRSVKQFLRPAPTIVYNSNAVISS